MMQHSQLVWVVLSMIKEQAEVNSFQMKKSFLHDKKVNLCLFKAKDIRAIY